MLPKQVWGAGALENSDARTFVFLLASRRKKDSVVIENLSIVEKVAYFAAVAAAKGSIGLLDNYGTAIEAIISNERLMAEDPRVCLMHLDDVFRKNEYVRFISDHGFSEDDATLTLSNIRDELLKPTLKKRPKGLTKKEVHEIVWEKGAGSNAYYDSNLVVSTLSPENATRLSSLRNSKVITSLGIIPQDNSLDADAFNVTTRILLENHFSTLDALELGVLESYPRPVNLTGLSLNEGLSQHFAALNLRAFICRNVLLPKNIVEQILKPSLVRLTVESYNFPAELFETIVQRCPNLNSFVAPNKRPEWNDAQIDGAKNLKEQLGCIVDINGERF